MVSQSTKSKIVLTCCLVKRGKTSVTPEQQGELQGATEDEMMALSQIGKNVAGAASFCG